MSYNAEHMVERAYELPNPSEKYRPVLDEFVEKVDKRQLADGLVLFGSSSRGEAKPESDLDVLTVVPNDWYARSKDFNVVLREVRESKAYKDLAGEGILPQIYPFYIETRQLDAPPVIVCEISNHGVIIYDPRLVVNTKFENIKRNLESSQRTVSLDGRIIWRNLPFTSETFSKPIEDRLSMLDTAIGESLEEAKFSFNRGVYNLCIRRSQEAVELSLTKMLLEMGVHAPKDHDMGETIFEILSEHGIHADPSIQTKIKEITISLTRMRGHAMHQTDGYGRSVAQDALEQAQYVREFTENFSLSYQEKIVRPHVLTVCGSMTKLFEMRSAQEKLSRVPNWTVYIPEAWTKEFEEEIRLGKYKDTADIKIQYGSVKNHYDNVAKADWVLIYNPEKHDVKGYIGPNTFWEVGFVHVLGKQIYTLNDYQQNEAIKDELAATGIVSLDGSLERMINYMEAETKRNKPISR